MSSHVEWNGEAWQREFEAGVKRNITAAAIYLANVIKADISQSGTLSYSNRSGKRVRGTIYNFTHSIAGNPPYKQTGRLRGSIDWEVDNFTARVGTNVLYGLFLEKGTRRMKPRPFLEVNMRKHHATLVSILTRTIGPGGLPSIASNQFRPGYLGAGARRAGYL
jgi:hypothetical protein